MDQTTGMILEFANDNQQVSDNTEENNEHIICRICYDDDTNEKTIEPCNCVGSHAHVHVSCLERWLSVSESNNCDICMYIYKTYERYLSLDECLRQKAKFWRFVIHFILMIVILFVWVAIVLACAVRTYMFFTDTTDPNSWCNGLAMTVITFGMIVLLWFWSFNCCMFWRIWRHANKTICLDQNHSNETENIINTTDEEAS